MTESGNSLVSNSNLISKVYFPRLAIIVSSVITSFVDFLISFVFLAFLMAWYRYVPSTSILLLPFFVVLVFTASLGIGLWISALMVQYRDFRFIVPFIVQFGLYISPVGFQTNIVPERFRLLYAFNPMVGIIDGFRWCLLGSRSSIYLPGLIISIVEVTFFVATGLWYFRKTERTFADVI
jgi:lipopolysaccharide transport system permease protein